MKMSKALIAILAEPSPESKNISEKMKKLSERKKATQNPEQKKEIEKEKHKLQVEKDRAEGGLLKRVTARLVQTKGK
jgi:hypothetical protein